MFDNDRCTTFSVINKGSFRDVHSHNYMNAFHSSKLEKVELKGNMLQRIDKIWIYFYIGSLYFIFNPSDYHCEV